MWTAVGTYGLSVAASDLDGDGWPDIYVANDSAPATLYQNQKDGTFRDIAIEAGAALSAEAKPQAGMGVSIGDYNRDGTMDVVKTNFAGDTDSLYTNLGDAMFEDHTYPGGLGENTRLLGWGVGFFDMDNDGWPDILMSNGHVYPEVDKSKADLKYAEHKYLYRNLQNGRFEDVTAQGGPGILENAPARGCAFGDYNNDGNMDVAVNCINSVPQLLRCDSTLKRNWIKIKLVGTKSNRSGIGSKVIVTAKMKPDAVKPLRQDEELRSGGSYFSQNDLRLHFGGGRGEDGGDGRDSLAERTGGSAEEPCGKPAVRDSGGRKDSEERAAEGGGGQGLEAGHAFRKRGVDGAENLVNGDGEQAFFLLLDACLEAAAGALDAVVEDAVLGAVGEPLARDVSSGEDGDAGCADGGGEVHGAGVVADEEPRAGQGGGGFARREAAAEVDDETATGGLPFGGGEVAGVGFFGRAG
jgi:hypothetical protein